MHKLIICNTHYQLIMALQMKLSLFRDISVSLIITDHIPNGAQLAEQVGKTGIFRRAHFIPTLQQSKRSGWLGKAGDVIRLGFGCTDYRDLDTYDEVLTYNYDISYYQLINYFEKKHMNVVWSKYDEGLFSYNTDFYLKGGRYQTIQAIRSIRGKPEGRNGFQRFYCFYPGLKKIHPEWETVQIPAMDDNMDTLKHLLSRIYQYDPKQITQKYIFFASSADIDGNPYGETDVILRIAEKVGAENLIVKMHPRDKRTIFQDNGISLMEKNDIPWEVMQITHDSGENVLLTVTSGAFISICAMMQEPVRGMFLYPEVAEFPEAYAAYIRRVDETIRYLHRNGKCESISVGKVEQLPGKEGQNF